MGITAGIGIGDIQQKLLLVLQRGDLHTYAAAQGVQTDGHSDLRKTGGGRKRDTVVDENLCPNILVFSVGICTGSQRGGQVSGEDHGADIVFCDHIRKGIIEGLLFGGVVGIQGCQI